MYMISILILFSKSDRILLKSALWIAPSINSHEQTRYLVDLLNIERNGKSDIACRTSAYYKKTSEHVEASSFYTFVSNDAVSAKLCDLGDGINSEIVYFTFPAGDVPNSPSYGV